MALERLLWFLCYENCDPKGLCPLNICKSPINIMKKTPNKFVELFELQINSEGKSFWNVQLVNSLFGALNEADDVKTVLLH